MPLRASSVVNGSMGGLVGHCLASNFSGVLVDSPRGGMDAASAIPLLWTWSNVAQAGYLVLDFVFIVYLLWQSIDEIQIERCVS